jgi:homoserine kinase
MNRVFPYTVLLASLTLAAIAAYYSVFGLSKLFSSQSTAVIVMASVLEVSKLISASYLHRYWSLITIAMRVYLTSAVFVLMLITSLGIYGFLVSAYQETATKLTSTGYQTEVLNTKRQRFVDQITNIQTELNAINSNVTNLTAGLANNTQQYTDRNGNLVVTTNAANRKALQQQLDAVTVRRDRLTKSETDVQDSITVVDMKLIEIHMSNEAAAELGPLLYVSKLTNRELDTVVNWFILLFIFVFDPLAIILLLAANRALNTAKTEAIISDNVGTNDDLVKLENLNTIVAETNNLDEYFDKIPEYIPPVVAEMLPDTQIKSDVVEAEMTVTASSKYPRVSS